MLNQNQRQANMGGIPGSGGFGGKFDQAEIKNKIQAHFQQKVLVVDDVDRQVWGLVSNVPLVSKPVAVVCAVLNFFVPGLGTLVAACTADDSVSKTQMTMALI